MQVGAAGWHIGLHHVLTHSYQLCLLPPRSPHYKASPPSGFSLLLWSEIKSVIQQNNLK